METQAVDVAVIGAGTAGLSARREAVQAGARVVLVEAGPYGTTCARVGCMPSKLLVAAADAAHEVRGAGRFGVVLPEGVRIDGRAVLERVRRERDRFVGFVLEAVEEIPAAERLRGVARFVGPTTLDVGGHTRVEAKAVVIATGSRPWIPSFLEAVRDRLLASDDVFELPDLPRSVAVVGTGVIGLELGQALHRLGVRTAFFSHSRALGPSTDPEVRTAVHAVLGRELDLRLDVDLEARPAPDGGVLFEWTPRVGPAEEERFDRVLVAAGRRPDLGRLDLEAAGLSLDDDGRPGIDPRTLQCGEAPVFWAGDVTADRPFLHEAADAGAIAGGNAARFPDVRAHARRTPLAIVFSDPQIALVGAAFRDLPETGAAIGQASWDDQGRARVMGRNAGLARIYADTCGTLLGAELFGPRVEHTAHLLAWAVQARLSVEAALAMPFYHPVIEEGIRTALRDLCARLKFAARERARDLECGPGA